MFAVKRAVGESLDDRLRIACSSKRKVLLTAVLPEVSTAKEIVQSSNLTFGGLVVVVYISACQCLNHLWAGRKIKDTSSRRIPKSSSL